jgi:hypothetical protein
MLFGSLTNFLLIVLATIVVGFLINYLFGEYFAPECPRCAERKKEVQLEQQRKKMEVDVLRDSEVLDELFQ